MILSCRRMWEGENKLAQMCKMMTFKLVASAKQGVLHWLHHQYFCNASGYSAASSERTSTRLPLTLATKWWRESSTARSSRLLMWEADSSLSHVPLMVQLSSRTPPQPIPDHVVFSCD